MPPWADDPSALGAALLGLALVVGSLAYIGRRVYDAFCRYLERDGEP